MMTETLWRPLINKKVETHFAALSALYDEGYRNCVMVAGSDRVNEYSKRLNMYNGKKGRHGFYNFKDGIKIVSAGQRDPDAEGVAGMSASKMRAAAASGDYESFSLGLPPSFKDTTLASFGVELTTLRIKSFWVLLGLSA